MIRLTGVRLGQKGAPAVGLVESSRRPEVGIRQTGWARGGLAALLALLFTAVLAAPLQAQDTEALEREIRSELDALDARTGFYTKHLPTGREIAIRADQPMNALSVIKVPVMIAAYQEAEAGRLNLDARYRIRPEDLRRGSGLLQTFAPGLEPTWRDLITQMIVTSDNTATDIVIRKVGMERVNRMLDSLGYVETRLRETTGALFRGVWELADPDNARLSDREVFEKGFPDDPRAAERAFAFEGDSTRWLGRTTAREMSRLLEQLQQGELAAPEHTDEMMNMLRQQFYSSRLPRRIGSRVAVAHKTGDWPPYAGNDVGILFHPSGPTVVSVFTNQNRGSFLELEETLGEIAELLVKAWDGGRDRR